MIQFNLLPDVKKDYVKARRTKRLIMTSSFLASVISIGVVTIMFTYLQFGQKKHVNDLTTDIDQVTSDIKSTKNLDTILSVQNQLSLLPSLHEDKPETSRLIDYIAFFTPDTATVSSLKIDVEGDAISISGGADSIATVNRLADNIKAVRYYVDNETEELSRPYSEVLSNKISGNNETASYSITMTYDPVIFDNTKQITMKIGNQSITQGSGSQQEDI